MKIEDKYTAGWIILAVVGIMSIAALLPAPAPGSEGLSLGGCFFGSTCIFHNLTGLPCPFCGLTRATVCVMHGQPLEALSFHPLSVAVLVFMVFMGIYSLAVILSGKDFPSRESISPRLAKAPAFILSAALLMSWIVRLTGA